MDQILEAILAGDATTEDFAALKLPDHYRAVTVHRDEVGMFEGLDAVRRGRWDEVASANQHFHRSVVALAGSSRLSHQMDLLLAEMRLFFHQMDRPDEFHRPYLEENAAIDDLLARGRRVEAADRLAAYLSTAEEQLVRFIGAPSVA